jgi:hypothetical protein
MKPPRFNLRKNAGVESKPQPSQPAKENFPDIKTEVDEAYKARLVDIFAQAKNLGETLWPDAALWKLESEIKNLVGGSPEKPSILARRKTRVSLKSGIARKKQLHHFAVDQFYKTYFPDVSGRGRPRLPAEDREDVKQLREAGASWSEIPQKLGDPDGTKAKDKYRKRKPSGDSTLA